MANSMTAASAGSAPCPPSLEVKGIVAPLTVLKLRGTSEQAILSELDERIRQLPQFFSNAPVVLDCSILECAEALSLAALAREIRARKMVPVGVIHLADDLHTAAAEAGLGVLPPGMTRGRREAPAPASPKPDSPPQEPENDREAEPERLGGLTVAGPIRSGQVVYAPLCDLTVLSSVNSGAEIIADGHIHVYGPLRGRALAGAHGFEEARIFCSALEAALVSIAGTYLTAEEIPAELRGRPAQVFLRHGNCCVEPLKT